MPGDWALGVADIVDSTGEIARGRYKTVNMVGAAVISAMINALKGQEFPLCLSAAMAQGLRYLQAPSDTARSVLAETAALGR